MENLFLSIPLCRKPSINPNENTKAYKRKSNVKSDLFPTNIFRVKLHPFIWFFSKND